MEEEENIPHLTTEFEKKVWDEFFRTVRRKNKQERIKRLRTYAGIAAIVLISFSIIGYNSFLKPDIYFAKDNNITITLADSSEIILEKGAKLTVEKSFPSDSREVKLDGNAVFKISKSKEHPFIVHGRNYETKVLGTVFKIYQNEKTFSVDLYEGKVSVYRPEKPNESFELKPKETFSNLGIAQVARISPTSKSTEFHLKSSLSFNDCSLIKVAQIIEETYNVKILIPDKDKNVKITISSTNSTAKSLIEIIAFQFDLNIKQINDKTFQLE